MESQKLIEIANDVENKSNKDLMIVADELNEEFEKTKELMNLVYEDKLNAVDCAFISHHIFEVIHPFIDGNGRTGRLLINKVLHDLGEEPIIIMFDDRSKYYDSIQDFRKTYWTGKQFILDK